MTQNLTTVLSAMAHAAAVRDVAYKAADAAYDNFVNDALAKAFVVEQDEAVVTERGELYRTCGYDGSDRDRSYAVDLASRTVRRLKGLGHHAWYRHDTSGPNPAYKIYVSYGRTGA